MADKNTDFNFEQVSVKAIQVIDSIRSRSKFGNIIPAESRINAFYRALGLPAVIRPETDDNAPPKDPGSVANVFSNDTLSYSTYEQGLSTRQMRATARISVEDQKEFLLAQSVKLSDGLKEGETLGVRLPLKPYVVNGNLEIFPQNRRVAGAFLKERELQRSGVKYKRPLLETIILMKLKGSGVVDSSGQNQVLPGTTGELASLTDLLVDSMKASLRAVPEILYDAVVEIGDVQTITKQNVQVEPIAEQNPVTDVRDEEDDQDDLGYIDQQDINLQLRRAIKESLIGLFEFDDTFGDGINNMKAGLLASEILLGSTTVAEDGAEEENRKDVEMKKSSAEQTLKGAYKTLSLILGSFTGISGVDIIVVITALIEMDVNQLIGLLNQDARDRLANVKGRNVADSGVGVKAALTALEQKVKAIYEELDGQLTGPMNYEKQRINENPEE